MININDKGWLYLIIVLLIVVIGFLVFKITSAPEPIEEIKDFSQQQEDSELIDYKIIVTHSGGYDGQVDYDNKIISIWKGENGGYAQVQSVHNIQAYSLNSVWIKDVDVLANLSVEIYENDKSVDYAATYGRSNYIYIER